MILKQEMLLPRTQNAPNFWADHWSPENPNGKYPRADAPLVNGQLNFLGC